MCLPVAQFVIYNLIKRYFHRLAINFVNFLIYGRFFQNFTQSRARCLCFCKIQYYQLSLFT